MTRALPILLALACATQSACTTCADSAEIAVRIAVDENLGPRIVTLEIGISVNGGVHQLFPITTATGVTAGQTILLRPMSTPEADSYEVAIDVTARNADGTSVAQGKKELVAATRGCNVAELELVASGVVDGDLAGADLVDLSTLDQKMCTPTSPDEDGDSTADDCDVCAASTDPTPSPDSDSDGLPDACDPNLTLPGNKRVYFEPFNATPSGWTGNLNVANGALGFTTSSLSAPELLATNLATTFAPMIQVQASVVPTAATSGIAGGLRMYLWKNGTTDGYRCEVGWHTNGNSFVELTEIGVAPLTPAPEVSPLMIGVPYRVSMFAALANGQPYVGCILDLVGGPNVTGVKTLTTLVTTDVLRLGLGLGFDTGSGAGSLAVQIRSVFAATFVQ